MGRNVNEKEYETIIDNTRYVPVKVVDEMKKSFISYAMAVNVSRAIPDVRDGLKPVHRRILFSMSELGLTSDKPFRKCALIVGDVLGKYHPHGDSSVYDALVRLAQDFSIKEPLVDGHGNFGSIDGDPAAAYRYTEARMSKISAEMLRDLDKETVDFYPNFDNTRMQPTVLPSRFPNLLVNGSDGIAVGMATSIPPHNLAEVINGTIALMDDPDIDPDELCRIIPGPDFPTGAIVMGRQGIIDAYKTGRGSCVIRAKTEIEEMNNGKSRIIITEIPYQVNKERLIKSMADLVKDKRIEGISDIHEESDRKGMRVVVDVKREYNANVVLNSLFKHTQLQVTFSMIMLALVDGVPRILNLKEILSEYIKHQVNVVTRRTQYDLNKAEEKQHILKGLAIAGENIDEVVSIIKTSRDAALAKTRLMDRFNLDEKQVSAILDMRLQKLTGIEVEKIENDLKEIEVFIADCKDILANPERVNAIIKQELTEIRDKYPCPRQSEISYSFGEIGIEDLIAKEDVVVSLSNEGYVKRMNVSEYRSQHRGGKGVIAHRTKEEDFVTRIFSTNTHARLLFFTTRGKVFSIKCYEIPDTTRGSKGRNVVNLVQLDPDEKVKVILPVDEMNEGYLVLATKKGLIKKTSVSEYLRINKNGKYAIKLVEGDELIAAEITTGTEDILMASNAGMCIRFSEDDIRDMGRVCQGVKSMKLLEGEEVIDMAIVKEGMDVLTITSKGFGKRSDTSNYRAQSRGGRGLKAGSMTDKTGDLVSMKLVTDDDDVMVITDGGTIIRTPASTISVLGRGNTQGVKVMRVDDKARIVAVAITPHVEEEEETEAVEGEQATEQAVVETPQE